MQYQKKQHTIATCRDTLADEINMLISDLLKECGLTYDTANHDTSGCLTSTECIELYRGLNQQGNACTQSKLYNNYNKFYYGIFDKIEERYVKDGETIRKEPSRPRAFTREKEIAPISEDEFETVFI